MPQPDFDDTTIVSDDIYDFAPLVFCSIEWSLQDGYTLLKRLFPAQSFTFKALKALASAVRSQLVQQSTAEGCLILEEGVRFHQPDLANDPEEQ